jgi:flagella basal body P-ring formation protein FlgA
LALTAARLWCASCVVVEGDAITAKDVATVVPAFNSLSRSTKLSYAPPVSETRTVPGGEIERWAAENGLTDARSPAICFERRSGKLSEEAVAAAIRNLFPGIQLTGVEVLQICQCVVPQGKLRFSLASAAAPPQNDPASPVLWQGSVTTEAGSTFPVWARVRAVVSTRMVRATEDLRTEATIAPRQVEEVDALASPLWSSESQQASFYEGKVLTRCVPKGQLLTPKVVRDPSEIDKGSLVRVRVLNGTATLELDGRAETSGNRGDVITITNPTSLRRFQGVVTGRGQAEVRIPAGSGG